MCLVLCLNVCLSTTSVPETREGAGSPQTGVTDCCELPCGGWESDLGPQEAQPALLTAKPSLQPKNKKILSTKFWWQ